MTDEELVGTIASLIAPIVGPYLAAQAAQRLWDELNAHGFGDRLAEIIVEYDVKSIISLEG